MINRKYLENFSHYWEKALVNDLQVKFTKYLEHHIMFVIKTQNFILVLFVTDSRI
jgi:hypothetical protein